MPPGQRARRLALKYDAGLFDTCEKMLGICFQPEGKAVGKKRPNTLAVFDTTFPASSIKSAVKPSRNIGGLIRFTLERQACGKPSIDKIYGFLDGLEFPRGVRVSMHGEIADTKLIAVSPQRM